MPERDLLSPIPATNQSQARAPAHHAVQEITTIASPRAYDRPRTLDTVLRPHTTTPAVGEVRNQIQAALTVA